MTYSELAHVLERASWDSITFKNISFIGDVNKRIWTDSVWLGDFEVSAITVANFKELAFEECQFSSSVFLEGTIGNLGIENCKGPADFILSRCNIQGLWIRASAFRLIYVDHSSFRDLIIDCDDTETNTYLYRSSTKNGYLDLTGSRIHVEKSNFSYVEQASIENQGQGNAWTSIIGSRFQPVDSAWIRIEQTSGLIHVIDNSILGDVELHGEGDKVTWNLVDNKFAGRVGFSSIADIGPFSYMNFAEIFNSGKPLGWRYFGEHDRQIFFNGEGEQIADGSRYAKLLRLHKSFYDFYLQGGDIQTANLLYTRIKDLETRHLEYQYEQSPSFDLWIRIHLNNLLKFYTRYGTDPARAIIISLWVIFWFGIFYLFFPSSWDVTSKSKLLIDFKALRNVGSGRYKAAFKLTVNALVALLNAFTLSLNSFVTLGFGEIPTKGVARYVTIAEGFLGWFLLTLFSVALISQSSF